MAKGNGPIRGSRIPAAQVSQAKVWQLPEITSDKVFKLASGRAGTPIRAAAFGHETAPAGVGAARSPRTGKKQQVITADMIDRAKQRRPPQPSAADEVKNSSTPASSAATASPVEQPSEDMPNADHEPAATATQGYLAGVEQGQKDGFSEGQKAGYEAGELAGKAAGEAAARAAFEKEVTSQREVVKGLVAGFDAPLAALRTQMEEMLVPLVTQISEAVILGELKQHPEQVRRIVSAGLQAMPHGSSRLQISVHPEVVAFVRDRLALEDQPVELLEDAQLAVGSCRIHSVQTNIDNSLSRNLRRCLSLAFKDEPGADAVIDEISESDLQQASETLFDA
ncbi:MAG: flagellar assembly protein FliH [Candidatus Azotimanducaceae bacterium]|jgi:flagellar assembly protein FliH